MKNTEVAPECAKIDSLGYNVVAEPTALAASLGADYQLCHETGFCGLVSCLARSLTTLPLVRYLYLSREGGFYKLPKYMIYQ